MNYYFIIFEDLGYEEFCQLWKELRNLALLKICDNFNSIQKFSSNTTHSCSRVIPSGVPDIADS